MLFKHTAPSLPRKASAAPTITRSGFHPFTGLLTFIGCHRNLTCRALIAKDETRSCTINRGNSCHNSCQYPMVVHSSWHNPTLRPLRQQHGEACGPAVSEPPEKEISVNANDLWVLSCARQTIVASPLEEKGTPQ